ncbi:MAG: ABC transporter permease [Actinomycetota bacterium]|nr:ABC transporter permease [Actinomycetota bacterium]
MHISIKQNLRKDRRAQAGLAVVALLFLFGIFSPWLAMDPHGFSNHIFASPGPDHWMGTNDLGQDIFSRLLYGLRTSMFISVSVGILATLISVVVGMFAGFIGGWLDMVTMRVIDALLVLPSIIIIILVSAFIRPGLASLIIIISLFHWQGGARIIRGQTLAIKQKTHITCARTFGAGKGYILARHIFPDIGNIIVVSFLHNARSAVFLEAGMAFIGISSLASVSLGTIMHNAFRFYYLPVWLWWLLPPGIMLALILLSFTFLGNLMEKVIDPRLRDA